MRPVCKRKELIIDSYAPNWWSWFGSPNRATNVEASRISRISRCVAPASKLSEKSGRARPSPSTMATANYWGLSVIACIGNSGISWASNSTKTAAGQATITNRSTFLIPGSCWNKPFSAGPAPRNQLLRSAKGATQRAPPCREKIRKRLFLCAAPLYRDRLARVPQSQGSSPAPWAQ
jgi:hypothetical protein